MSDKASSRKTTRKSHPRPITEVDAASAVEKSLVFISHDSRDFELAEAFATMLAGVSAGMLKSFRSSDKKNDTGIGFGEEWYATIMARLTDATDVVALLTPQSLDRPWILYEAGVAKGKLDTTVLGVALGVPLERVSTGPFGQFQNCGDDEDSLTTLVTQLLSRNPQASPVKEAIQMQVGLFKTRVQGILEKHGGKKAEKAGEEQGIAKLFEEVKAMVRELPDRFDGRIQAVARRNPMRKWSKSLIFLEEFLFHDFRGEKGGIEAAWLMAMSLIREEIPWIYESGIEVYRSLRMKRSFFEQSVRNFQTTIDITLHSRMAREFMFDGKDNFHVLNFLQNMSERLLHETLQTRSVSDRNQDTP